MVVTVEDAALAAIYSGAKTIAIVGASNDPSKASYQIAKYLKGHGFRIIPVNPRGGVILGEKAYTSLDELDVPVDIVDVFRPAPEAPDIARQAVRKKAKVLWLQTGISSEEAAAIAKDAGLTVIMDACMGQTHARLGLGPGPYALESVQIDSTRKRWTLVAAVLGSGIVFLDSTIVNVALPEIGRELSSSFFKVLEAQSYIYYGYLLSLSALLILAGAFSDHHGRRRMFGIGLAGFGVTSFICGLAPNMELLILFRILQGAAGAILVPGALSIITATFHGEEQGRAFGIWAGASAATTILGPVVGGALVTYISWRAAFLMNLPLVALALWATYRYVMESRDDESSGRFHWSGAGMVALAVGGLTFGTIRGEAQGWRDSIAFAALGAGAAATVLLPWVMRRAENPLVPPNLFRSRNFTIINISTLLVYGAIYVTFYVLPLFAIGVLEYNAVAFGLAGIPSIIFMALFSTKFGALAVRFGPRLFVAVGPALMGLALMLLRTVPPDSAAWVVDLGDPATLLPPSDYALHFLPSLTLFGIGLMVMVAPLTAALMRSIPERHAGVASAVNNAISRVGPQLAGALLFVGITANFYSRLSDLLPAAPVDSQQFREVVSPLNPAAADVSARVASASQIASTEAFHLAMLVAGGLCLAGALINGLGVLNPSEEEKKEAEGAELCCPGVCTPAVEGTRRGRAA